VADDAHPFGYGRLRYLYAFIVSIILFTLGGLFALYEGWHKVHHPEPLNSPAWAFGVLVVAIGLESWSLRTAVHESNPLRGGRSWWSFLRHAKAPELPVVLLEDTGALLGLAFALVGVTLAVVTGNGAWDGVGSLAIGVLLVAIAIFLAFVVGSLLVGEGASAEDVAAISSALAGGGVRSVIHLRTLYVGPDDLMVAAKVAVPHDETAAGIATAIDEAEARVRAVVPHATLIYLEPDIRRSAEGGSPPR
jgi:cation diffusion facilitator family transporter